MTRVALETSRTRRKKLVPAYPGHALIAQYHRDIMMSWASRSAASASVGGKHLVVVFEKMFERFEYERFIVQDQQLFLHFALCDSRFSGIFTINSVPTPSSL